MNLQYFAFAKNWPKSRKNSPQHFPFAESSFWAKKKTSLFSVCTFHCQKFVQVEVSFFCGSWDHFFPIYIRLKRGSYQMTLSLLARSFSLLWSRDFGGNFLFFRIWGVKIDKSQVYGPFGSLFLSWKIVDVCKYILAFCALLHTRYYRTKLKTMMFFYLSHDKVNFVDLQLFSQ